MALLLPLYFFGQTIINDIPGSTPTYFDFASGQSFTATIDGVITQIDFVGTGDITNGSLRMYPSPIGSGAPLNETGYDYIQTGINIPAPPPGDWYSVMLDTPYPVTAGNQYTFILTDGGEYGAVYLNVYHMDTYAGGFFVEAFGLPNPGQDIQFQIWESEIPSTPLKAWVLFPVIMVILIFFLARNRQKTEN
ncbi:MAG: hypothetical protein C0593_00230 [Marinilabiliales bacterium]|nr:MAG: hypothetical protein C0593_00230 [Marinilabiliales bacterium]